MGTRHGHRLIQLAKTYTQSHFTGIDLTQRSLNLAKELAQKHHIKHINFDKIDLLDFNTQKTYDVILSTGVVVALEDPLLGLMNLTRCLNKDGYLLLWLYHSHGEFHRLLQRELIFSLMNNQNFDLEEGVQIMKDLELKLSDKKYGSSSAQKNNKEISQIEINVDAYLHPIVNTYLFSEAFELLNQCGLHWASITSINNENNSMLVDLPQVANSDLANFCIRNDMFLPTDNLIDRYNKMSKREKYKVIELSFKPNGFVVMAGFDDTFLNLNLINHGNVIRLTENSRNI